MGKEEEISPIDIEVKIRAVVGAAFDEYYEARMTYERMPDTITERVDFDADQIKRILVENLLNKLKHIAERGQ